ncbi:CynX/NimT family MFS transporter [Pseudonocardia endophytica]|uniref:CP family cyanate transporter-like MFS transporter n=1 Tax=Pseudonocardia endophytica TaxID=401976 RepID=A0A4R1HKK1_PSEEN|nr:MFS transporter [Pseudonocardia endophytica]TCK22907.1 CP family cyanate transporter-like MFS transporter [Pseudonocardia endophytica]
MHAPRPASAALLITAIVLFALNLRGPIVAVTPVLDVVGADLRASAATVALLVSLPVLCFGVLSPPASWLLARAGLRRGVLIGLGVLLAGTVLRSADGLVAALAGTLLIGGAITVGNVAVPVVIGRDLPERANGVLAMYTSSLNVGSMITLSFTAPIASVVDWRLALLTWCVLVLVSAAVWWWAMRNRPDLPPAPATDTGGDEWWRRPLVWALSVAFAGQAFAYYGITGWLPLILRDLAGLGAEASGVASSPFQIAAIAGAFGVPLLLRRGSAAVAVGCVVAAWVVLVAGLLFAPGGWAVWCAVGGVAQGGGLTLIFALVVRGARDETENRRMSATVQGVGYTIAAAGPTVLGAVHDRTAGWTVPLLVALGSIAVLAMAGTAAALGVRAPAR